MLPPNIDLTEHMDFSGGNGEIFFDTPIEIPLDEYRLMSNDEYEHLMWWEGIFGRKRHYTSKSELFKKPKINLCHHCGKLLRIPWYFRVCRDCYKKGNTSFDNYIHKDNRIPWAKMSNHSIRNVQYDLFNRR